MAFRKTVTTWGAFKNAYNDIPRRIMPAAGAGSMRAVLSLIFENAVDRVVVDRGWLRASGTMGVGGPAASGVGAAGPYRKPSSSDFNLTALNTDKTGHIQFDAPHSLAVEKGVAAEDQVREAQPFLEPAMDAEVRIASRAMDRELKRALSLW